MAVLYSITEPWMSVIRNRERPMQIPRKTGRALLRLIVRRMQRRANRTAQITKTVMGKLISEATP